VRLRDRRFWFIQTEVLGVTALHLAVEGTGATGRFEGLHHLPLILYLIPVIYAALRFGMEGGMLTSAEASLLVLPNITLWHRTELAWAGELLQVLALLAVGFAVSGLVEGEGRARRNAERAMRHLAVVNAVADLAGRAQSVRDFLTSACELIGGAAEADRVWVRLRLAGGAETVSEWPPQSGLPSSVSGTVVESLAFQGASRGFLGAALRSGADREAAGELLRAVAGELVAGADRVALAEEERRTLHELRASEERYRRLFEEARDAILVVDHAGVVRNANRAAGDLFAVAPEHLPGRRLASLLGDFALHMTGSADTGNVVSDVMLGGRSRTIAAAWSPILLEDGSHGIQALLRDVTREHRERASLRQYAREVTRAQEEERKRIARELHDDVAQSLMLMVRRLKGVLRRVDERFRGELEEIAAAADALATEVRRFGRNLRPSTLDDLGLIPALEWLVADVRARGGPELTLTVEGEPRRLTSDQEVALFRIAQEGLRNIERHANAQHGHVTLSFQPSSVLLTVEDDGQGFDPLVAMTGGGLGLLGMRERAELAGGTFEVDAAPGAGVRLRVSLPDTADASRPS
jgi:PAS domain S-box-containing protein